MLSPPKPRTPRSISQRLPERKRLTAILGFNCTNGILLLADTEEVIGDVKSECEKLTRLLLPNGVAIMGGAGDSHSIEYAVFRAGQRLMNNPCSDWAKIHNQLNDFAKGITKETVAPYKGLDWQVVPAIEMLIALYSMNCGARLFRWANNVVTPVLGPSASTGCGVVQMHPMLSDLQDVKYNPYSATGSINAMLFHGVRIMRRTKRTVKDCGKRTEAMALTGNGTTHTFGVHDLERLEKLVEDFEQYTTTTMLAQLVCWEVTDQDFEKYLAEVPSAIREFRREFLEIVKPSTPQNEGSIPIFV